MLQTHYLTIRIIVLLAALIALLPDQAMTQEPAQQAPVTATKSKLQSTIDSMSTIQQSIEAKQKQIRKLREKTKKLEYEAEQLEVEQNIEHIRSEIAELQKSFEQIALGGINLTILSDRPEERINWRDEVEQISRPLLSTLKELTAKPRQIDSLNRDIERRIDQLKVIDKALESIRSFDGQELPPVAAKSLKALETTWEQHRDDTQRALDISLFTLENIRTDSVSWQEATWEALSEFFRGRGLTLLLVIVINIAILLLAHGLRWLYLKWLYRKSSDTGMSRAPLILYSYRLATAIVMIVATLMVFYVRGDLLLLTLAGIVLVGAALALRQTLPRYAAEIRLLLGVGPVREQERLVLEGVPYQVESLGVYTVLRNPALDGIKRLPLHTMNSYTSRPSSHEPWFPTQAGDYVLLPNGKLGNVLRQTIELVELYVFDSRVQYRSADFIALNISNLSREGFGIAATFGIDYRHQSICLDTVPACFREAILERFRREGLGNDIREILVEFKAAGSSSLDYQIYLVLEGRAASAYYRAQRLVQQACVDTCNREGWGIPFTQITVHSADDRKTVTLED